MLHLLLISVVPVVVVVMCIILSLPNKPRGNRYRVAVKNYGYPNN